MDVDSHYGDSAMNLSHAEIETLLNGRKQVRYLWEEFPQTAGHALLNCGHIVPWHRENEAMQCPIDHKQMHIYRVNAEPTVDKEMSHAM
jgi:hypothetical protein